MDHYRPRTTAWESTTISEAQPGDRCRIGNRRVIKTASWGTPRELCCWWSNPKAGTLPATTGPPFAWPQPDPPMARTRVRIKLLLGEESNGERLLTVFTPNVSIIFFTTVMSQFIKLPK